MFENWLKLNSSLKDVSIYKYSHAVDTISKEMMDRKVISKPIKDMELYEVELAILLIFRDEYFVLKNKTGDSMYSNALKWFRNYIQSCRFDTKAIEKEEARINSNTNISITEREAIIKARIGQGKFREQLIAKYGSCIITGIDMSKVLVASHIKPWAASSNEERISVDNGLLLSATFDRLFDNGYITFAKSGVLKISKSISEDNMVKLGIAKGQKYNLQNTPRMSEFLEYHSDAIFIK